MVIKKAEKPFFAPPAYSLELHQLPLQQLFQVDVGGDCVVIDEEPKEEEKEEEPKAE